MAPTPSILLIASPLEDEHVARLRALAPDRLQVLHDKTLLPTPRFPGDHQGGPFQRSPQQQARWQAMLTRATVLYGLPDPADLPFLSRLAWVQTTNAGVGPAVARLGLDRAGVLVTTARGVHAGPLAEWVFMALLSHMRGLDHLKAEQAYARWERHSGEDLAGRTLVLIGAGELARACARVARAFDMRVVAVARDPARPRPHNAQFDAVMPATELHVALGMADFLVMTAPHTPATEAMLDAAAFAALKPGALFINIGRGQTVDHDALGPAAPRWPCAPRPSRQGRHGPSHTSGATGFCRSPGRTSGQTRICSAAYWLSARRGSPVASAASASTATNRPGRCSASSMISRKTS